MSEKKLPLKINTDDILDPQTRWDCQRLDKIYRILMDLTTEIREINGTLKICTVTYCRYRGFQTATTNNFEQRVLVLQPEFHQKSKSPPESREIAGIVR